MSAAIDCEGGRGGRERERERERGGGERESGRVGGIKIYSTKGRREGEEINERKRI